MVLAAKSPSIDATARVAVSEQSGPISVENHHCHRLDHVGFQPPLIPKRLKERPDLGDGPILFVAANTPTDDRFDELIGRTDRSGEKHLHRRFAK